MSVQNAEVKRYIQDKQVDALLDYVFQKDGLELFGFSTFPNERAFTGAYHKLAILIHPDKNNDSEISTKAFQKLHGEYEELMKKYEEPGNATIAITPRDNTARQHRVTTPRDNTA